MPASKAFVTDSNRPQPPWQPPPTACLTAAGATSEAPSTTLGSGRHAGSQGGGGGGSNRVENPTHAAEQINSGSTAAGEWGTGPHGPGNGPHGSTNHSPSGPTTGPHPHGEAARRTLRTLRREERGTVRGPVQKLSEWTDCHTGAGGQGSL